MKSRVFLFSFFLYFTANCTSLQHRALLSDFDKGINALVSGKVDKAKTLLVPLCQTKHKASCVLLNQRKKVRRELPIMQGVTTFTSTQMVVSQPGPSPLRFFIREKGMQKITAPKIVKEYNPFDTHERLFHISFEDLKPGGKYDLLVIGDMGEMRDLREFRLFNKKEPSPKIAVLSCMRDDYKNLGKIWKSLESRKSTMIFMTGDNSYIDQGLVAKVTGVTPKKIWQRHMETRFRLPVFRWKALVPIYGIWDDHDYGVGDGGKNFQYKKESANLFRSFFPLYFSSDYVEKGPGISFSFQWQKQNFIFLDNRSFRDKDFHFGEKQKKWLLGQINEDLLNWLISGDQFFGGYHKFDSFQGNHPESFQNFLSDLNAKDQRFLFLSGDRHLSEIIEVPKKWLKNKSFEITSSPVHSSVYANALKNNPNSHRRHGIDGTWNYVTIDISTSKKELQDLRVKSENENGEVLFEDLISI